jgi:hypothetical protein
MVDLLSTIGFGRDNGLYVATRKVGANGISVIALVCQQGFRRAFGQVDQSGVGGAVSGLAMGQMEGDWSSLGVSQTVKLTGEPAPRAAKSSSTSPPFPPAAETWARSVVLSML